MKRAYLLLFLLGLGACTRSPKAEPRAETPAPVAGTVRFAVIGDFGADTAAEAAVAKLVHSWKPEFVITTGDNNYPLGEASTIDDHIGKYYADFIGGYHGAYGPGSKNNRFWPSPGNHDWGKNTLAPYLEYFSLPGNERYYDVDLGLVHLYAVDSDPHEPDGTSPASVQGQWLKARLAASKSCYDLVFFHHPPYSSGAHGSSENMRWPFREWGAEAVLAGHDHTYERFEVDGIPYFVNGLGGASKYEFNDTRPIATSKYRTNEAYGAMLVTARKEGIAYQFFGTDGTKLDEVDIPARCTP
jgi:tartrate-resistant acid phosphatase type 5